MGALQDSDRTFINRRLPRSRDKVTEEGHNGRRTDGWRRHHVLLAPIVKPTSKDAGAQYRKQCSVVTAFMNSVRTF